MPFLELQPFGLTDAGKVRQNNEDAMLVGDGEDQTLFVVADGIGGFEAGEVASSLAVDVLKGLHPDEPFETAIAAANRRILTAGRGDEKLSGMGTTVVAIRFGGTQREPTAEVAHVGDSRAYLVRGGEMKPITEDHSLVAELVRSGDLTRDQAAEHPQKNLITRALGADEEVDVDTTVLPVEVGDRVLLCSDGLSDMVSESRISEILLESPDDPERAAQQPALGGPRRRRQRQHHRRRRGRKGAGRAPPPRANRARGTLRRHERDARRRASRADHGERYVLQGRPGPLAAGRPRAASGGVVSGGPS